jgi:hypothetical protein
VGQFKRAPEENDHVARLESVRTTLGARTKGVHMEMTSTKAELVHIRDFPESVTATIPRADFEAALGLGEPAELFLEVKGLEGDAKGESRDVSVTWTKEDLEQLLAETTGPAITLAFDQDELQSILAEPEVDAHGFREKALILTVAAAAAAGSGASVAAAATHDEAGLSTRGITPSYVAVHDEAGLTARGIEATPLVASHDEAGLAARGIQTSATHDEATLAARGIDAGSLAATHDEATLAARGIDAGSLPAQHDEASLAARGIQTSAAHDEATLAARGIEPGSVPATNDEATLAARGIAPGHLAASHDEATLTARGITPADTGDDGGITIDVPTIDATTATAVGAGVAGLGLLITAAGFAARRQRTAHPA